MSRPTRSDTAICGIDEVGRGPLAGPVVAAAVVLSDAVGHDHLRDSKALSAVARDRIYRQLRASGSAIALGWVWPREIDRLNIHHATLEAMHRAFTQLVTAFPGATEGIVVRVDGKFCPPITAPCSAIVGGDRSEPAIMAASVVAKVLRDRWMTNYHRGDPRYNFAQHKGYPTPAHQEAIARYGPDRIHRRSFRGVLAEGVDRDRP